MRVSNREHVDPLEIATGVTRFGIESRAMPLNPLSANLGPWLELVRELRRARGSRARLGVLLGQAFGRSASKPLPGT